MKAGFTNIQSGKAIIFIIMGIGFFQSIQIVKGVDIWAILLCTDNTDPGFSIR